VLGHFIGINITVSVMQILHPVRIINVTFAAIVMFIGPTKFLTRKILFSKIINILYIRCILPHVVKQ